MRVFVRARTKSKRPGVTVVDLPDGKAGDAHFVIAVAEPPIEGRANAAVAKALAEHLGISQTRVMLISGSTSREKVFQID